MTCRFVGKRRCKCFRYLRAKHLPTSQDFERQVLLDMKLNPLGSASEGSCCSTSHEATDLEAYSPSSGHRPGEDFASGIQ